MEEADGNVSEVDDGADFEVTDASLIAILDDGDESESDVEFEDESLSMGAEVEEETIEEFVMRDLESKRKALSILCSAMVLVVFFVFILRNDIAFPAMLPEDGKVPNYASCEL